MESEEVHYVTIKMTYEEARKLAVEIDNTGHLYADIGKDPINESPMLTELWNKLP